MTNQEKFIQVFGVAFDEFDERDLFDTYSKQKKYKVTLMSWRFRREPLTIYVNASTKKKAREKAIEQLGDEYRRFGNEHHAPTYKLLIEREWDKE